MRTSIYALFDPREPEKIRYIGKTSLPVNIRLNLHISKARREGRNHRVCWLRKLAREGVRPVAELLGSFTGNGDAEEVQMIAFCRMMGLRLTNTTPGGDEGGRGYKHSEESKQKMREAKIGTRQSEDHKRNKSLAYTDEIRAGVVAKLKGRTLSDEHKANIMEGMRRATNRKLLNKLPSSARY